MRYVALLFLMLISTALGIQVENGAADVITYFVMRDKTTGEVDTGVTVANLEMYYIEDQTASTGDKFVGAHGAPTDAHTDGECIDLGFGVYRVDWEDAAFDGGIGKRVQLILVDGDGGAFTEVLEVELSPPSNAVLLEGGDPSDALDKANTDINLDHLVKMAVDTNFATTVHADSVIGYMTTSSATADYVRTTDSLEDLRDRGDAAWITATGFAVASDVTNAHTTTDAKIDTTDGLINGIDDNPWDNGTRTLTAIDLSAITGDKASYKATGFAVSGEPLTAQEVEDTVWDAVLTGNSHNDGTSAGRRLRQVEHTTVLRDEEQAQGGSASTITLHDDASSIDGFYDDAQVVIVGDLGIEQSRHIHSYVGNTRVASITPDWITIPDATSDYVIMADSEKHVHEIDDDVITAAVITDAAWQELIELMFSFDATGAYGDEAGSVVDQMADNAASGGATAQQVWEYDISAISNTDQGGGALIWLFNVMEGDSYIDTTQTPWQAVTNKKGTPGTEYLRKDLFDVSGGNVTSTATVIGKQTEP